MCTTAAVMFALSIVSGKLADPGSASCEDTSAAVVLVMRLAAMMQSNFVADLKRRNGGGVHHSGSSSRSDLSQRQIKDVVDCILSSQQHDSSSGSSMHVGSMVECFGPIHSGVLPSDADVMPPAATDGTYIVESLHAVLHTRVRRGDAVVVTAKNHTTCMYRSWGVPDRWYVFDSMHCTVVCVLARDDLHRHLYGGRAAAVVVPATPVNEHTPIDADLFYTALIIRSKSDTATAAAAAVDCEMVRASPPLASGGGGAVVRALRESSQANWIM